MSDVSFLRDLLKKSGTSKDLVRLLKRDLCVRLHYDITFVLIKDEKYYNLSGVLVVFPSKKIYQTHSRPFPLHQDSKLKDYIRRHNVLPATIYPIYDGTIVTLYYHDKRWKFATNKSVDYGEIQNTSWKNKDIINEVLDLYSFDYEKLDIKRTYTIGYKNTKVHFYSFDKNIKKNIGYAWFIKTSIVDDKIYTSYSDDVEIDIGIPKAKSMKIKESSLFKPRAYDIKNKNVAYYGYLLKSANEEYTIQFPVMNLCRQMLYKCKCPFTYSVNCKSLDLIWNISKAIVGKNITRKELFFKMFPQFENVRELVMKRLGLISKNISEKKDMKFESDVAVAKDAYNEVDRYKSTSKMMMLDRRILTSNLYQKIKDLNKESSKEKILENILTYELKFIFPLLNITKLLSILDKR